VDDHDAVGVLGPERLDLGRPEALVDRAVAPPQQERGRLGLGLAQAAEVVAGIPDGHLRQLVAHRHAGVAPEVLIGEEQDLVGMTVAERPLQHGPGVGRGAHGAAVAAHERFQGGRGVHVGDRDDPVDVHDLGQRLPGLGDLVDVGHVGHRAARVEVGEDHALVVAGEDVGRLGHEVHAAEHDVVRLGPLLRQHRQPVGVAAGIGPPDDLVPLIVVAEDEQAVAESGLGRGDPGGEVVRGRPGVPLRERGLKPKHWVGNLRRVVPVLDGGDSPVASPTGMSSPEPICSRNAGPACPRVYAVRPRMTESLPNNDAPCAARHVPPRSLTTDGGGQAGMTL
jgi:hypothetical protein